VITVNNKTVSRKQLLALPMHADMTKPLRGSSHHGYAVCLNDPLQLVAIVEQLRELGQSVLLLPSGLPFDAARQLAIVAGCRGIVHSNSEHYHSLPAAAFPVSEQQSPSLMQFSSGTTGKPKLISRAWEAVEEEIEHYNHALSQGGLAELQPIILASASHSFGLVSGILSAWQRGQHPVLYQGQLQPKQVLASIRSLERHLLYAVPTMLGGMADLLAAANVRMHAVITSGAPMSGGLFERCRALASGMHQQYGCTEAGCISLAVGMESHDDLGMPLRHVTAETAGTAGTAPAQSPAEFIVRVGGQPAIRTGDSGYMAASGRLRFAARIDDLINVSGLKVRPLEVEEVIGNMPGVIEVVVYKGVHPLGGDRVCAQVRSSQPVTEERIKAWCMKQLPPYKVPTEVLMVDAIPRTWTGKISRRLAAQGGAQE
jgi:3,4-dihydroxybenzoate---[aryl-carrier protein] ligase